MFFQLVDTLSMGGAERMSVNIAGAMEEDGWESHLVVSRSGGGLEAHLPSGVNVHLLNKSTFYDLGAFYNLIKLFRKHRPLILHAHSTSIYWAVLLKIVVGDFHLIWHDHFGLSDQLDKYPRKDIVVLSKWIDRIIVVNEKLKDYWRNLIPYRKEDITYIGNFPWLNLPEKTKCELFTFLNLANLRPQKDQITLLKACKILVDQDRKFKVQLVGEYVDQEWTNQVKDTLVDLNLEGFVELVGPVSEVSLCLAKAHAGILSSESEGLPVALLEYGLAGLPVICTQVGDCPKVLSSPDLGILVPKSSPEELALAMDRLLSDYSSNKLMGEKLQEKIIREYGKGNFLDSYYKIIPTTT